MEYDELEIRVGTPLDVSKASKRNLVLIHEEMRRQKELMERLGRNAKILSGVRTSMEAVLGIDHQWDLDSDYNPDDPPEKKEAENPLARLFGG